MDQQKEELSNMEQKNLIQVIDMKEFGGIIKKKEKEFIIIIVELYMKEIGEMVKWKEK